MKHSNKDLTLIILFVIFAAIPASALNVVIASNLFGDIITDLGAQVHRYGYDQSAGLHRGYENAVRTHRAGGSIR